MVMHSYNVIYITQHEEVYTFTTRAVHGHCIDSSRVPVHQNTETMHQYTSPYVQVVQTYRLYRAVSASSSLIFFVPVYTCSHTPPDAVSNDSKLDYLPGEEHIYTCSHACESVMYQYIIKRECMQIHSIGDHQRSQLIWLFMSAQDP